MLFLLNVALGHAKLRNARMDVPVIPSVQHHRDSGMMEVDEPQAKTGVLEVDGFGSDHDSAASQPRNTEPAGLRDDTDPWNKGYITNSGRKVVPVKRYAAPSVSSSSSRRCTNSTRRSSKVRSDKL